MRTRWSPCSSRAAESRSNACAAKPAASRRRLKAQGDAAEEIQRLSDEVAVLKGLIERLQELTKRLPGATISMRFAKKPADQLSQNPAAIRIRAKREFEQSKYALSPRAVIRFMPKMQALDAVI